MNPQSQKQLVQFLKTVQEGISKKEFITAFTMLKNYTEDIKQNVDETLAKAVKNIYEEKESELEEMEEEMETMCKDMDSKHEKHATYIMELLNKAIKKIEDSIPEEVDLKPLENKIDDSIAQLRSEIPTIPKIPTPDTGEQIVDKINALPTDEDSLKIDKEHIKGLTDEIKELRRLISASGGKRIMSGPRRDVITKYSLTSQCNGVTKAFTLPMDTMDVLGVFGTQFPVQYDASGDWTFSGRTLTLGSSVGAPETGQVLWALITTLN
jgi:hypothetical protein